MKKALPEHAKLSKESKECIQECVSEFISFITSQAADRCLVEKRKTLNGEDVLWAMYTLGFENYSETLKIYLAKYRQVCNILPLILDYNLVVVFFFLWNILLTYYQIIIV